MCYRVAMHGAGHDSNGAPSGATEARLVERLKAGDDDAFEALVRDNTGRMLAVARRLVGEESDARDVVQDAFLAAFRGIDRFGGHAKLSTWLHRIVVNTALMKLRAARRRPEEPIGPLLPSFADDGHHNDAHADWGDPEQALAREETRHVVRQAIQRLPDSYRSVLVLRDIEELDTRHAADALGLTENAVKIRLHRARQALRTLLAARLGGGSA